MLARVHRLSSGRIPLIGIGGIDSGETALAKIQAGASLVQLYTGLVFGGANLIRDMQHKLAAHVRQNNLSSISQVVATKVEEWAAQPLVKPES